MPIFKALIEAKRIGFPFLIRGELLHKPMPTLGKDVRQVKCEGILAKLVFHL